MTFSEKLIRLRKINCMTQEEFSKKVGVSRQAVYKWECGQSYPEAMALVKIKELFGVSIDNLLDDGYEVQAPEKKKRIRVKETAPEKATVAESPKEATEEKPAISPEKKEEKKEEIKVEEKKEEKKIGFLGRLFRKR